ncbi:hypothetical protein GCM10018779_32560 [Streptomyces griseocarneus]|nr:hypothetical protein GCM10018779_32560 [Streptomyces griseocarneus]
MTSGRRRGWASRRAPTPKARRTHVRSLWRTSDPAPTGRTAGSCRDHSAAASHPEPRTPHLHRPRPEPPVAEKATDLSAGAAPEVEEHADATAEAACRLVDSAHPHGPAPDSVTADLYATGRLLLESPWVLGADVLEWFAWNPVLSKPDTTA